MKYNHEEFDWFPWWEIARRGLFLPLACMVDVLYWLAELAESACEWWLDITKARIDRIRSEMRRQYWEE
ncbi:hypothetical protein [Oceanidesulfovibrio marinus]|nr:hypothetical protein [Oceanidesulfovibrio marinus]